MPDDNKFKSKFKPMCHCRMQEMGEGRWVKPYDGYFDPDPNCKKCDGKGYKEVEMVFGKGADKTFVGICPICGSHNGVYFIYPGINDKDNVNDHKPLCKNKECLNEFCEWVDEMDVQE